MLALLSLLLLLAATNNNAAKLPGDFPRCKLDDPKLNECMDKAITLALSTYLSNGIPSLQLLPVDPLDIEHVDIQHGGDRPVGVKLSVNKAKLHGLKNTVTSNTKFDTEKRVINCIVAVKQLRLEGDYVLDGKILQLPLKGKGKCQLLVGPYKSRVVMGFETKTKKGEVYWNLNKFTIDMYDVENFHVNFENLFNGDKALGEAQQTRL
ncbi:hypothetical protein L9F63_014630 [Diploptera punctata]|uniref:Uncharacterized protein n=1 Tax=Diploptera punctata TaxID=6984 RepID=A0AAD8A7G9_DIPPU|nr:hypothetical protein L9F63_014630 [Diploptera punctata]